MTKTKDFPFCYNTPLCRNLTDDVGEDLLRETFGQFGEMEKVGGGINEWLGEEPGGLVNCLLTFVFLCR